MTLYRFDGRSGGVTPLLSRDAARKLTLKTTLIDSEGRRSSPAEALRISNEKGTGY